MEEIEQTTQPNFWNKPQSEITVAESIKAGIVLTAVAAVAPIVAMAAVGGVKIVCAKVKERRAFKKLQKLNAEKNETEES